MNRFIGSLTKVVHSKYTHKNGKKYGPYFYETHRVNGKIVTKYLGTSLPSQRKRTFLLPLFIVVFLLIFLGALYVAYQGSITGNVALELDEVYRPGEVLDGSFTLLVGEDEFIPASSRLHVRLGSVERSFTLQELLIGSSLEPHEGSFYVNGKIVEGYGTGYGLSSVSMSSASFFLELIADEFDGPSDHISSEASPPQDVPEEDTSDDSIDVPSSDLPGETEEDVSEEPMDEGSSDSTVEDESSEDALSVPDESASEEASNEGSSDGSVTGAVIGEEGERIAGSVQGSDVFTYTIPSGYTARLVSGSVQGSEGQTLSDETLVVRIDGSDVHISLSETRKEETRQAYRLSLPLRVFDLIVENSTNLSVSLTYGEYVFVNEHYELTLAPAEVLNDTLLNETTPVVNVSFEGPIPSLYLDASGRATLDVDSYFTGASSYDVRVSDISVEVVDDVVIFSADSSFSGTRIAQIHAEGAGGVVESNEFSIIGYNVTFNVQTVRKRIVLGEPVHWITNVTISDGSAIELELPAGAENISVTPSLLLRETYDVSLTGEVSVEAAEEPSFVEWALGPSESVSGYVVGGVDSDSSSHNVSESLGESVTIVLEDNATAYVVEYYTDPPAVAETQVTRGKRLALNAPSSLGYNDVVVITNISQELVAHLDRIRVYWINPDTSVAPESLKRVDEVAAETRIENLSFVSDELLDIALPLEVPFETYDQDEDGLVDSIGWVVPHFSEQIYEIILITKADHLNETRTFISDIFDSVRELDGNWSEPILDQHYVRVTFERNLTRANDITIYPRILEGSPVLEVYEKDQNVLLAVFDTIAEEDYYKLFLTELPEGSSQDVFDLRVVGGSLSFDHIIDPVPTGLSITHYNFTGITSPSSTHSARFGSPAGRTIFLAGTEAASDQYTNMSSQNGQVATTESDLDNDELFWRFTFNVSQSESDVSWIFFTFTGSENAAEVATAFVYNFTSNALVTISTLSGANNNLTLNLSDAANFINGTSNNVVIYVEGANYDPGDVLRTDFAGLQVAHTPVDTLPPLVTIIEPQNATYTSFPIPFNISTDENSTANYTLDGGLINYTMTVNASGTGFNATNGTLASGVYTARYYARDISGVLNATSAVTFSVDVDQIPPSIAFVSPTPANGSTQTSSTIFANISSTDASTHYTLTDFNRDLMVWASFQDLNASDGTTDYSSWEHYGLGGGNIPLNTTFGRFGNSFHFRTSTHQITFPTLPPALFNNTFSVALWVYPSNLSILRDVAGTRSAVTDGLVERGFALRTPTNNRFFASFHDGTTIRNLQGDSVLENNTWYHVALVYDSATTTVFLYVNGSLEDSSTVAFTGFANEVNFSVGRTTSTVRAFQGNLDEVVLFNRTLAAEEVLSLYNATAYQYAHEFANLSAGQYNITGHALDVRANKNSTELRQIVISPITTDLSSCAVLDQPNYNYTLITDINASGALASCINITASNVSLNCNNFQIRNLTSFSGNAIYARSVRNISINNCKTNFTFDIAGIFLQAAHHATLTNVEVINSPVGVQITNSHNATVRDSRFHDLRRYSDVAFSTVAGSMLTNSPGAQFVNNSVYALSSDLGSAGFSLATSNFASFVNNSVYNVSATQSRTHFDLGGSSHAILLNNIANCTHQTGAIGFSSTGSNNSIYNTRFVSCVQAVVLEGSNYSLSNITINASGLIGLQIGALTSFFHNVTFLNSSDRTADVQVTASSANGSVFADVAFVQRYNLTGIGSTLTFRSTRFGEIAFLRAINGSGMNLSFDIQITNNTAFINASQLGLNKSANISFYGLPVVPRARMIRDSRSHCFSPDCVNLTSLAEGGTIVFNVSAWSSNYSVGSLAPLNTTVFVNSTSGSNRTEQNLNCFTTLSDLEGDTLNVTTYWYNQSVLHLTQEFNDTFANGTFFSAILDDGNTTKGHNWTCGLRVFDGISYTSFNASFNVTIFNTPPTATLVSPADAALLHTQRGPQLNFSLSDLDGDALTWQVNITLQAQSTCTEAPRLYSDSVVGSSSSTYVAFNITPDLRCLYDNLDFYNWSVRANDSESFGVWTTPWRLNITSVVSVRLLNGSVEFGPLIYLEWNDTSDDSPRPFLLENDGNSFVNVTLVSTQLWTTHASSSPYYQYKGANYTLENGSFNWGLSRTNYFNISIDPEPATLIFAFLNYTDATDTAEIDINLTVPPNEPPGVRRANITLVASLTE